MMEQGYLERLVMWRRGMLAGLVVWMIGWTALVPAVPAIARITGIDLPIWWGITIVYALDRGVRLRSLYLAGIASWFFFLVHNLPLAVAGVPFAPMHLHWAMLIGTGFAAGMANGRRSAAVAALGAAALGVLWIAWAIHGGQTLQSVAWLTHRLVFFELPLIVFGGLLADLALRIARGRPFAAGPSLVLWALIAGLVVPRLAGALIAANSGNGPVGSVSLPATACRPLSTSVPASRPGTGSSACSAAARPAASSVPRSPASGAR
jgi:hypothetical protein